MRDLEATGRGDGVGHDLELVVLRGDGDSSRGEVANGVIAAMVPVRQAASRCTRGEAEQLMAETDTHHWRPGRDERAELLDNAMQLRGIARAVRQQDRPGLRLQDLFGGRVPAVDAWFDAARLERADDVPLGSAVQDRDRVVTCGCG